MCISPNIIDNPYYGFKGKYAFMHDCVSKKIKVPCGYCSECVKSKQLSIVQRTILENQAGYPFFCTLTYNNESLPQLVTSNGYIIRYADVDDVRNMIKRLRNDNAFGRPFRYFVVSELGSKRARPHFHILFFLKKYEEDNVYTPLNLESVLFPRVLSYWCRNYGSRRVPDYRSLCSYTRRIIAGKVKTNYDLHYVQPSTLNGTTSDVGFYVTKYMMKPSDKARRLQQALKLNLDSDEYKDIWNKVKPRWFSSLNYGFATYGFQAKKMSRSDRLKMLEDTDSFKFVRSNIVRSRFQFIPSFYNPETGLSFPLARYWKSFGNLYTEDDAIYFHNNSPYFREDNVNIDDRDISLKLLSEEKHFKRVDIIDSHLFNLDLLFD